MPIQILIHHKLKKLELKMVDVEKQKRELKEDQTYSEAVRNMLQDTGIKTKIIKQYLPIMNKLTISQVDSRQINMAAKFTEQMLPAKTIENLISNAKYQGFEGIVFKSLAAGYADTRQPWLKLKRSIISPVKDSADLLLLGCNDAFTSFIFGCYANKNMQNTIYVVTNVYNASNSNLRSQLGNFVRDYGQKYSLQTATYSSIDNKQVTFSKKPGYVIKNICRTLIVEIDAESFIIKKETKTQN